VLNNEGKRINLHMGSYGIGVSRLTAAIIEAYHDEKGIKWPFQISPFKINIISALKDEYLTVDQDLYLKLSNKYKNVSLDDRDLSLGKKIKDSELVGIPWTLIIGKKYEQNNQYEIINRSTGEKLFLSDSEVENFSFEQYTP
jgi:prolyl-tRNA synthetase